MGTNKSTAGKVLVDLYNLHLSENMNGDKSKILSFFREYAPRILRYKTAAEIEAAPTPRAVDDIGTLGLFERQYGEPWFDHPNRENFYSWYRLICEIADNYFTGRDLIPRRLIAWVSSLTDKVRISLRIMDDKHIYGSANVPDPANKTEYKFEETYTYITSVSHSGSELALGGVKFRLFRDILALWNGDIKILPCAFAGSKRLLKCKNILVAGGRRKYCSKRCYDRARRSAQFLRTGK